jgi:hypothetical protein
VVGVLPRLLIAAVLLAACAIAAGVAAAAMQMHMHDMAPYPDMSMASKKQVAQARALWARSRHAAPAFYRTGGAAAAGYRPDPHTSGAKRPYVAHWRLHGRTDVVHHPMLDTSRPESLMYWYPKHGRPVLIGYMYRAPRMHTPKLGGPILMWHSHSSHGRMGPTAMTHVWLTRSLRTAYARCMPVMALEKAKPRFHYAPVKARQVEMVKPCPMHGM